MGFKRFMKGLGKGVLTYGPTVLGVAVAVTPAGQVRNVISKVSSGFELTGTVVNAITSAAKSDKAGAEKFADAMKSLEVAAPLIIANLEATLGVDIPEETVQRYMVAQVQANYELMKSIGMVDNAKG